MWHFLDDRVLFIPDSPDFPPNTFEFIPILLEEYQFDGVLIKIPMPENTYGGFDTWWALFPREKEVQLVQNTLKRAQEDTTYRAHIHGISLAESVELLRKYYKGQWYEDSLAKKYTLPKNVQVTASISLRHALWCEKDKRFLSTKDTTQNPFWMLSPPIRWSHDLRILQQALRMNIIMGIEVYPGDEKYITLLLEQEILSPFAISQMIEFWWKKYGWCPRKCIKKD